MKSYVIFLYSEFFIDKYRHVIACLFMSFVFVFVLTMLWKLEILILYLVKTDTKLYKRRHILIFIANSLYRFPSHSRWKHLFVFVFILTLHKHIWNKNGLYHIKLSLQHCCIHFTTYWTYQCAFSHLYCLISCTVF